METTEREWVVALVKEAYIDAFIAASTLCESMSREDAEWEWEESEARERVLAVRLEGEEVVGKTWTLEVDVLPEPGAGLPGLWERVHVTLESGEPLGDAGGLEWQEYLLQVLRDWFATPHVRLVRRREG